MNIEELVSIRKLSIHYEVNTSFFSQLNEFGLIEIHSIDRDEYIHQDKIGELERIIRLHLDLNINMEGIDTIINLLARINRLENELNEVKNKLLFYEGDLY